MSTPWLGLFALLLCASSAAAEAPAPSSACPNASPAAARAEPSGVAVVDLNTADESALLTLPGIGPARARAIVEYRNAHGSFRSVSQLLNIKGIGRALLKQLRPLITVANASA